MSLGIRYCSIKTPLGSGVETYSALIDKRVGLKAQQFLPDSLAVPLCTFEDPLDEEKAPRSWKRILDFAQQIPQRPWGSPEYPIVFTSSTYGVGSLFALRSRGREELSPVSTTHGYIEALSEQLSWGPCRYAFSHACVTAHLGLACAEKLLESPTVAEVLIFSVDILSPFVIGGFASLKILNEQFPAPYAKREVGSIGLGDGMAAMIATRPDSKASYSIDYQCLHNEMYHFTSNEPEGVGFKQVAGSLKEALGGRKPWFKGHGTGTLQAGQLESEALAMAFPDSPLLAWKGSIGHTLGSCGLVELGIVLESLEKKRAPGTVGTSEGVPCFAGNVETEPFSLEPYDAAVVLSNAFGGAHAAYVVSHNE